MTTAILTAGLTVTPFRVLVTGSRTWTDEAAIRAALAALHREHGARLVVVHGACPTGADAVAERWCRDAGVPVERYPADWSTYGRSAGPHRNREMVNTGPDLCLAFILDASRGATGCADAAKIAGISVRRHERRTEAVPCRDPWCRNACGFTADEHIKAHGPGILITAKVPADRVVDRRRTGSVPPVSYARALTPAGGACGCPGCDDPGTTECVFGGRHTPHPLATTAPPVPAQSGDEPAMSTPTTTVDKPADTATDTPAMVAAEPGSRLEALLAEYERLKPVVDAAAAHLKTVTDAIKVEATAVTPGATRVDISSPVLSTPLRLQAKTSWRLDTKRMKQENPLLYVTYAYQSTAWELRSVSAAGAA
jgi:hypothetical protein